MNTKFRETDILHLNAIKEAALDTSIVSLGGRRTASVHEFYRYPARFSPRLVAACIEHFTETGDMIFDPFGGGGTSAVESQLLGRHCVSADINSLANFITRAKVKLYSDKSLEQAAAFSSTIAGLKLKALAQTRQFWPEERYWKNVSDKDTWRIRNYIATVLSEIPGLEEEDARTLVKCALLRTGQWALDMRKSIPTVNEFRDETAKNLKAMAVIAESHRRLVVDKWGFSNEPYVLNAAITDVPKRPDIFIEDKPRLILTSPPYPGVYVNYHRWKIKSRKESPIPYWIVGSSDGHGQSHYTMSARSSIDEYFRKLKLAFESVTSLMNQDSWLVQIVGFPDDESYLARYLEVMASNGLIEYRFNELATNSTDGRLWRQVPGRRWWVSAKSVSDSKLGTSREVVLIHHLI